MKTQEISRILVPEIDIYGVGDVNKHQLPQTFKFKGEVGAEIENLGYFYSELHAGSIALRDQATLFQAYLLSELGGLELPEDVKKVVYQLFDTEGYRYGNVTNDACDYKNVSQLRKTKPTDKPVRWIVHPERFIEMKGNERKIWKAQLGDNSKVYDIVVPKSGYVEYTDDGAYRTDTGTPFSTVKTREEAEKSLTKRGFSPEFAEKAISQFERRAEGAEDDGDAVITRWHSYADGGRFYIDIDHPPNHRNGGVGYFFANRLYG